MKKIILITVLTLLITSCTNINSVELDKNHSTTTSPYSNSAVCTLKISAAGEVNNGNLEISSQIDKNPMKLSFGNLNKESPVIIGNTGEQSNLLKIDNGNYIYLLEETDAGNLNIFTLFRDKNIMTLTKQYSLFGKPFSLLMIGDCISGYSDINMKELENDNPVKSLREQYESQLTEPLQDGQQINPDYLQ